jgi:large subunit ribosomal protein L10
VTEYRGLTVAEQQQLRRSVRQAQGEYRVLKMSLARLAVEDMSLEGLSELLEGPTALAFANEDPVPVAKALRDFASDHDNLIIKGGILGGALLPPEQISRLAAIESREILLSKIAGGFKAPMSKLAGLLGAKMRDAASVFSQLLEKKEDEQGPAPEVPEAEVAEVPEAEVAEVPEAEVAEVPEAEVAEVPEAEVAEVPEPKVAKKPAPKKKAAAKPKPKPKPKKSPAKADASATADASPDGEGDEAPADGSDETAEEE